MLRRVARLLVPALLLGSCFSPAAEPVEPSTTATSAPQSGTTAPPGTATTTAAGPTTTLAEDPALVAQIEELQSVTESMRGLEFAEPPQVTVVSDDQLAGRVRDLLAEELPPEEVAADQALLTLLGVLEPGTDLATLYSDLYTEQIAGFYDGETGELVVPSTAGELSPLNRVTMVHELIHALEDQYFGFYEDLVALDEEQRYDEASALQALVEGTATFYQVVYIQEHLTLDEQLEMASEAFTQDTAVFDRAPAFLRDSLIFPYVDGQSFVTVLFQQGAAERLDQAFGQPPVSTEQVIHPELYLEGEAPVTVELPATHLSGYQQSEESVWGELGLRVLFSGTLESGHEGAEGWGGDRYRLLWNGGEQVAMLLHYVGDSESEAVELEEALLDYVAEAMAVGGEVAEGSGSSFTGDSYAFVGREGDRVELLVATDPLHGEVLREQLE